MKTCLLCIDAQADFLPGGSLAVPDGDKIIHPLTLAAQEADLVIASRDWHPPSHKSFKINGGPWPGHCMQDTPGAKIHPKIRKLANYTVSKGMDPDIEAYSAFVGSTLRPKVSLEDLLEHHAIQRVLVGGLTMDVCVRYSALDASALGYLTIVMIDCTRPLSIEGEIETLRDFDRAGVLVQTMTAWKD